MDDFAARLLIDILNDPATAPAPKTNPFTPTEEIDPAQIGVPRTRLGDTPFAEWQQLFDNRLLGQKQEEEPGKGSTHKSRVEDGSKRKRSSSRDRGRHRSRTRQRSKGRRDEVNCHHSALDIEEQAPEERVDFESRPEEAQRQESQEQREAQERKRQQERQAQRQTQIEQLQEQQV